MATTDLQINCLALILPLDLVFLCFIQLWVLCLNVCDQLLLDYNDCFVHCNHFKCLNICDQLLLDYNDCFVHCNNFKCLNICDQLLLDYNDCFVHCNNFKCLRF